MQYADTGFRAGLCVSRDNNRIEVPPSAREEQLIATLPFKLANQEEKTGQIEETLFFYLFLC